MMKCERCGATEQEAPLTTSHAPQRALAKIVGGFGYEKKFRKYCLCVYCHMMYSRIENRILRKACELMIEKHEEYINR